MSISDPASADTALAIEAAFGLRWGVWLSDTGTWWAARTQPLTSPQINASCQPYVRAGTPDELTEAIREQESLA